MKIRSDSKWNVPEPELTLAINTAGKIFGYTLGNDMSSRDIEGENPLYLPQAKCYDRSAALGPCLVVSDELPELSSELSKARPHWTKSNAHSSRWPIGCIAKMYFPLAPIL